MGKDFDTVDRHCLLYKLHYQGIKGKLYDAIKAMYSKSEFDVKENDYINDLALELRNMNLGVKFGDEVINILLYAADMVILAEN